jgi:hypothetical protein
MYKWVCACVCACIIRPVLLYRLLFYKCVPWAVEAYSAIHIYVYVLYIYVLYMYYIYVYFIYMYISPLEPWAMEAYSAPVRQPARDSASRRA